MLHWQLGPFQGHPILDPGLDLKNRLNRYRRVAVAGKIVSACAFLIPSAYFNLGGVDTLERPEAQVYKLFAIQENCSESQELGEALDDGDVKRNRDFCALA